MEKPGGLPIRPGFSSEELNILFADGHVEGWTAPAAMDLLKRVRGEMGGVPTRPSTSP
jgi:prepilin-type processing-associated H-X9-DG protein